MQKKRDISEGIDHAVKLFEMGYDAAFDARKKMQPITRKLKVKSVKEYMEKINNDTKS